ncbi:sigma-70 family RNA polymerase sigma factor [Aciditerrimonas ferrireducens]|uniref:RNA polymerase sigma factor n=1 Tax=Aciditerrimonas ferrireducens TaxID=667306 RepID=A0ABV6C068_9ACTN
MTVLTTSRAAGPGRVDDVDLERDRVLVERAQAGDQAAFDLLYQRYYRRLLRFCLQRLHDIHEAEDVTQEAFARAWRALPTFGGERRFYPWLSVIAAHLCTDVLRRRHRATPMAELERTRDLPSQDDDGETRLLAAAETDLVAQAFQRLSDRHRRVLELREASGLSYQEIADHEGVGVSTVEALLWRARQALKREFSAVAGTGGRLAGVLAGLLGLTALRRWLRSLGRLAHHAAQQPLFQATAAVTTAAALGAGVVLGTGVLAGPAPHHAAPATAAPSPGTGVAPTSLAARTPTVRSIPKPGTAQQGAGTADQAAAGRQSAGRTSPSEPASTAASSASPASGTTTGDSLAHGLSATTSGLAATAGGLTQTLGHTVGNLVGTLDGSQSLAGTVSGLTSGLGSTVEGLGSTVSGLGSTVSGTTSALGGTLSSLGGPLEGVTSAVGSTVQQAGSTVGQVVGALGSTVSTVGSAVSAAGSQLTRSASGSGTTPTTSGSSGSSIGSTLGTLSCTTESLVGGLLGGTTSSCG